jgi:hypothetical protein
MNILSRTHWTTITVSLGVLLVGGLSVINSVELSRLTEQNPLQDTRIQRLALQVADLARPIEQPSPEAVSLNRYDAERQTLEQRLSDIEQTLNERLSAYDLQPLRDRLDQLETRLAEPPAPVAVTRPNPNPNPNPNPKAKSIEPAFQIIGAELRADERFLAILPVGAKSLSRIRLLRVGDKEDGWQLEALEDETATFSQSGKSRRMNLTARGKRQ